MVLWVESSKQEFTDCRDVCVCILYVDVVCVLFCASNTGLCAGRFECVCVCVWGFLERSHPVLS